MREIRATAAFSVAAVVVVLAGEFAFAGQTHQEGLVSPTAGTTISAQEPGLSVQSDTMAVDVDSAPTPDPAALPVYTAQAEIGTAADVLTIEVAKQKANGKLIVYATSTDSKAMLSITAQSAAEPAPIDLGAMSKTDANGNEYFIIRKNLPPIAFVVITSTAGGSIAAQIDKTSQPTAKFYVAPNGNDSWSGTLPAPNPANTNGPFATLERARAAVQSLNKSGLSQVIVQLRGGTYFLPSTQQFTAADSGAANTKIVYENFPGESPVISGGMRLQNWTNVGGNKWQTTLPASTQYFEQLFYNGERRLRPRPGRLDVSGDPALGLYFRVLNPKPGNFD